MNWYVTKLCFEIRSGSDIAQAEEQIRMLQACSESEAYEKAFALGSRNSIIETRRDGIILEWKFLGIRSLYALPSLKDEQEIYSTVIAPDDIFRYRNDLALFHTEIQSSMLKESIPG